MKKKKLKNIKDYDDAKLEYDIIFKKWQANNEKFGKDLLRSRKSYKAKYRTLKMSEDNQSYQFIEESDRLILSTIASVATEKDPVVFMTNDSSIVLLESELEQLFINVIKGKTKYQNHT